MLTKAMRNYVMAKNKQGYNKSEYNKRLEKYSVTTIKDLILLTQELPEDLQANIFNADNLRPLFNALFKLDVKEDLTKEEIEKRRKRLLLLCYDLFSYLGLTENALKLAPKTTQILKYSEPRSKLAVVNGLEAIYIESLTRE